MRVVGEFKLLPGLHAQYAHQVLRGVAGQFRFIAPNLWNIE